MLIQSGKVFIPAPFESEKEIEDVVSLHADYIFGPSSIYLPKTLISTKDGAGTIPDGIAIDFELKRWFVVEVELSSHHVWNHIAPQVSKQLIASTQTSTKKKLIEVATEMVKQSKELQEKFDEVGVEPIDIRSRLSECLESEPIIGIPIDSIPSDLEDWAKTFRTEVKLWQIKKYRSFEDSKNIFYQFPEEFSPSFETQHEDQNQSAQTYYGVSMAKLIAKNYVKAGDKLFMTYKPKGRQKLQYEATVNPDGTIDFSGNSFTAPSFAALAALKLAGSNRTTVNGWTSWKNSQGRYLSELRTELLKK